jgi:hypothetical protein
MGWVGATKKAEVTERWGLQIEARGEKTAGGSKS